MTLLQLSLALLALLLTPGPTNTLLAVAGIERGFRAGLRLVPAEVAGYLATTLPLALFGAAVMDDLPGARAVLTGIAALWVLWLAYQMWQRRPEAAQGGVTGRRVFVTTLLNPKALIIGLILLPAAGVLWQGAALFVGLIAVVAALWAALGAGLVRTGSAPRLLRRGAAVWLALLSAGLAVKAMAG